MPGRFSIMIVLFLLSLPLNAQLFINEIQASNISTKLDPDVNYRQWIEIYNAGNYGVDLYGYYISDEPADLQKFRIYENIYVAAKGRAIIWLDPDNKYYGGLSLDMDGGELCISTPSGDLMDHLSYLEQYMDISYGRENDGATDWCYFRDPTPDQVNNTRAYPHAEFPDSLVFSLPGGFYLGSQMLNLSGCSASGEIRYTTNGSWPTESSQLYSSPLSINSSMVIRARVFEEDKLPGEVKTNTYFLNEESSIPIISISTDPENFFSGGMGIYVEGYRGIPGLCSEIPVNWNRDWERPINIEYYTTDGNQVINQMAGTKVFGGCSRTAPFKSLALYARKRYGDNSFSFPFFSSKSVDEFKGLVLRNSGNDAEYSLLRDGFMQSLVMGKMDVDYLGYQPANVFVNGEYFGILNVREKINEHYVASNYDIDPDQIDMLEKEAYFDWGQVISGVGDLYAELIDYVDQHDLSEETNFKHVSALMDVEEFLNYYLAEIYFENEDWPQNNIKYWRYHGEGGKWRWILFDTDFGWGLFPNSGNSLQWATRGATDDKLIRALLENEKFKYEFIQRMASFMNTIFHPDTAMAVLDSIAGILGPEIPRHAKRWGRPDVNQFEYQTLNKMPRFAANRPDSVRRDMQNKFGIPGMETLSISVDDSQKGYIEAAGVELPGQFSGDFFTNVPLRLEALPKSGYTFSHWEGASGSGNSEIYLDLKPGESLRAVFKPAEPIENILLNEVGASNDNTIKDEYGQSNDWIEIYNNNDFEVDLAGCFLSDSAAFPEMYQLPYGKSEYTTLGAGEYLVIWCDGQSEQGALHTNFKLSKEAESLYLSHRQGGVLSVIDSVVYTDQYTDLTFGRNPETNLWDYLMPTPGKKNWLMEKRTLFINEYMSKNEGEYKDEYNEPDDWIEIYNPTDDSIDIAGLFLTDSLQVPLKHQIPTGDPLTIIPPRGYRVLWADGQEEQGVLHLGFKLNAKSEQIGLYQVGAGTLDSLSYRNEYPDIPSGRFPDGSSNLQFVTASPGSENHVRQLEGLYINEFMAKNGSSLSDEFGEFDDWIEIYNANDYPVDLGGVFISDSLGNPMKHRIPTMASDSTIIPARGHLVLWADGQEEQGVLHLDFKLDGDSEQIGLYQAGTGILDSLSYGNNFMDTPVGRFPDGSSNIQFLTATPGSENHVRQLEGLYINEFMAKNGSSLSDEFGEFDDWIEIYNANDYPVDLGGVFLTDSLAYPANYRIPGSVPDSTTIPAHGFIVLWADGQEDQGVLHLGFSLSAGGEQIGLVQPDGHQFIDSLSFGPLYRDQALGLLEAGDEQFQIVTASPGFPNYRQHMENIYISEFVASGNESNSDEFGEYDDWIEIYNDNDFKVNIGGIYLSDSSDDLPKFQIPVHSPDSTSIEAKGHLVLWADNQPEQGIHHLGFSLQGEGEFLALTDINRADVIDSLSFPNQYKHFSYSREGNTGAWKHFPPTFGEMNTAPVISGLFINEFMASNINFPDENGEFDDWIEIYNANNYVVDVGGLYLTDSLGDPTRFRIPSHSPGMTSIHPHEYLVLFADDQKDQGIYHLNFKLSREGEQIALLNYDELTMIDSVSYPKQFKNASYSRLNGGWFSIPPSPGARNTCPDLSNLLINEVMGNNRTVIVDDHGEFEDWIELYNKGDEPIDIGGLYFTDSLANPYMFRIPSESPDSTTIQPYDHLTLWADNAAKQGILHLGFKISKTGQNIGISDYTGQLLDSISYPFISQNLSWGRMPDGYEIWTLFLQPTPSESNMLTYIPESIQDHGKVKIYPNPVRESATFEILVDEPGKVIIEIINSRGSVVSLLQAYATEVGSLKIPWDMQDVIGSQPVPGVYMYRIVSGGSNYSGKFIIQ